MSKIRNCLLFSLLLLVTAVILFFDFSRVDDVPYHETIEEDILDADAFSDSDSSLDTVSEGRLIIYKGDGEKKFAAPISVSEGDALVFSFDAVCQGTEKALITVDLYGPDFDNQTNECSLVISESEGNYCGEIGYSRDEHPDQCDLRVLTNASADIEISNFRVDRICEARNNNRYVRMIVLITVIMGVASFALFILFFFRYMMHLFRVKEEQVYRKQKGWHKEVLTAVCLFGIILGCLIICYHRLNISYPLAYTGGDEMGIFYLVKTIARQGTTLVNPDVGGIFGGDMFDYPYSDKLSFLIVKFISLFTGNVYLITNLFYFLNFFLNGFAAYYVCRKLEYRRPTALLIGALFAFCPFIQMRYAHMWLTSFYTMTLACLLAVNVIRGSYIDKKGRLISSQFAQSVLFAFICAFTGLYYAYFTCALIAAAWMISLVNSNKEKSGASDKSRHILYPFVFIGSTICGVVANVMPNILYWFIHGMNPGSQVSIRSSADSEVFALKLVQLVLPRRTHRIAALARLTEDYAGHYPLVNENMTSAIGIIASVGLVISLLLIFSRREQYNDRRPIAFLNLSAFIIATVGGIGSLISVVVNIPMRCYNRMSIVIMYLSLLCLGCVLEAFGEKHRLAYSIAIPLLLLIGLYDQTNSSYPYDYTGYRASSQFYNQIDELMNDGDMIFELPFDTWPTASIAGSYRQFTGYIETDGLIWNYGSMEGREESNWQRIVAEYPTEDFLKAISYDGYDGVSMDMVLYVQKYGEEETKKKISELTEIAGHDPIVSEDGRSYFWDIRQKERGIL